ncbi:SDR family oxidoreductase [Streptomyces mirabilis]|jgi:NAD(P)-dependent dehydrogenase (short-subunit alcohol dehydrogenase family)|uniref:NAD(P)-dependent dehydrogenase, short-chain alcohol dehydrogenase family n=1 Tax=Streptomyces mirabilis TaxID=68239 RepID=A0A1I2SM56_9ACTN|nr:SDR family oxidoreductase [Streptomyces mirabilis]SFG53633.1 NAD(P)-dependent dehydrogenase, short-chain alcohol dehydrogenase family [Streptomyces mirabilis]
MRVVIMGGTSGIGLATAETLTADGAEVIVTGRDVEKLAAVKDRVAGAEQVDGASESAVTEFFERIGSFDHLVLTFSPGALGLGPLAGVSLADIKGAFDGKLFPYLFALQKAQVTGSVTVVSAATARAAAPGTVTFAAVNGAIERIVPPLATELSPVRVNAVAPGAIDTPWWSFLPDDAKEAQFAAAAEGLPARRIGTPDDVADAIRYLIGSTYVTGTILPVDGGFTVS